MCCAARACYPVGVPPSVAMARANAHHRCARMLVGVAALVAVLATLLAVAHAHEEHVPGERKARRQQNHDHDPPTSWPTNRFFKSAGAIALPGRGLSLTWSPDGGRIAVGGHFRDKMTRLRYDTRIADVDAGRLVKSFACHWDWVVSSPWVERP